MVESAVGNACRTLRHMHTRTCMYGELSDPPQLNACANKHYWTLDQGLGCRLRWGLGLGPGGSTTRAGAGAGAGLVGWWIGTHCVPAGIVPTHSPRGGAALLQPLRPRGWLMSAGFRVGARGALRKRVGAWWPAVWELRGCGLCSQWGGGCGAGMSGPTAEARFAQHVSEVAVPLRAAARQPRALTPVLPRWPRCGGGAAQHGYRRHDQGSF